MEEQYEEKPKNKGEDEQVCRYLREIELSLENEKHWRKDADSVWDTYRSNATKGQTKKDTFNILWANTEIKRHNLYNALPEPDIRPRHARKDPVAKAVSELLKRAVSYTLETQEADCKMKLAVNDMLIPGRGTLRVRYKAQSEGEEVVWEEALIEHPQWEDLIYGPGREEDEVTWKAFQHELTKDEVKERFPDFVDKLSYDVSEKADDKDKTVFKKTTVYELWDRDEKKVYWLGKNYKDAFLKIVDDPLNLRKFWPCPRPLLAVEDSASTIPLIEYAQYETQARELEKVSRRRNKIVDAIRARGVYDSTISEMKDLMEEEDAGLVPAADIAHLLESGGLEKAIYWLPIEQLVGVYQVLGQQRQELVGQIYELTGISDILRGDTNPNETKGAQQIKANFATSRLERQKQAVEYFARDLVRLIAEIVSEFSRETLSVMTGMEFPTAEEQQAAQMGVQMLQQQAQRAQMMGADPAPYQQMLQQRQAQAQDVLGKPNWEQIEEILRSDLMRDYRIDIETNSTISTDKQREQESVAHYLNAMGQFSKMMEANMASGLIPPEAARKTMAAVSRKFGLGHEIAEIFEEPIPPQRDPEADKMQMEMQMEQQKHQMEMQAEAEKNKFEQAKMQMEMQIEKMQAALEAQKAETEKRMALMEASLEERKAQIEAQALEDKARFEEAKHNRDMEKLSKDDGT